MENDKSGGSRVEINKVIGSRFVSKNVKKGIIISFSALLAIYLGISLYFLNHFYFGTKINGVNISGKTVKQADELVTSQTESYTLKLNERGDNQEQIKAADIGLKCDSGSKIQELKDHQNPFGWIISVFKKQDTELAGIISFDDDKLNKVLDKLNCLTSKDIEKPESAKLNYSESGYEIVSEINGNEINKDSLNATLKNAILNGNEEINLDSANCYEKPKFTANSQEVLDAKNAADKYLTSKITYTIGNNTEIIDKSTIHNWIEVNDSFEVVLNEAKVQSYVYSFASKYNTYQKNRDFTTSSGTKIKVGGGDYGWIIDKSAEKESIIEAIKDGQSFAREPKYEQTAKSHDANDIGNTYVEINLSAQHLWYYKNGSLVVEGNVVTGNVGGDPPTPTPAGVYFIKYKEKDATLKGPNADGSQYSSPVSFWMPFNGGIGLHDAPWRNGVFGGGIYLSNGSHGCVNCPYELAKTVFENIDSGTPVVLF